MQVCSSWARGKIYIYIYRIFPGQLTVALSTLKRSGLHFEQEQIYPAHVAVLLHRVNFWG